MGLIWQPGLMSDGCHDNQTRFFPSLWICKSFHIVNQERSERLYTSYNSNRLLPASNNLKNLKVPYCHCYEDAWQWSSQPLITHANSLLVNLPNKLLTQLKRLQNAVGKMVVWGRKFDHAKPLLKSLRWLPIIKRIRFRVAVLIFRCLNGLAPNYLSRLIDR